MANDFSIDLETLSNKYNSPILSIGVAGFNRDTGKIGPTFYVEVDPDDALRHGVASASTIAWWVKQSDSAKRVFAKHDKKLMLRDALQSLGDFLRSHGKGVPVVWGNGSSFDITVLEHAYNRAGLGLEPPWHFWNIRDMRTAVDMAQMKVSEQPKVGTHHNALDDAIFQGTVIADCFRKIAGRSAPVKNAAPVAAPAADEDEL